MTDTTHTHNATTGPSVVRAISLMYGVLLKSQLTKGKLIGLGLLGLGGIGVSALIGAGDRDVPRNVTEFVSFFGIGIMTPLVCLLIASSVLGNLIEDRLLVYVWLKPLPRWYLAVAAFLASLTVAVPLVVLPVTLAAIVGGWSPLVLPIFWASLLASAGYCGLFTAVGVRFSRGLWWGLLYILIWENFISQLGNAGLFAIRSYALSIVERSTEISSIIGRMRGPVACVVVPLAVAILGMIYAGRRLETRDIE